MSKNAEPQMLQFNYPDSFQKHKFIQSGNENAQIIPINKPNLPEPRTHYQRKISLDSALSPDRELLSFSRHHNLRYCDPKPPDLINLPISSDLRNRIMPELTQVTYSGQMYNRLPSTTTTTTISSRSGANHGELTAFKTGTLNSTNNTSGEQSVTSPCTITHRTEPNKIPNESKVLGTMSNPLYVFHPAKDITITTVKPCATQESQVPHPNPRFEPEALIAQPRKLNNSSSRRHTYVNLGNVSGLDAILSSVRSKTSNFPANSTQLDAADYSDRLTKIDRTADYPLTGHQPGSKSQTQPGSPRGTQLGRRMTTTLYDELERTYAKQTANQYLGGPIMDERNPFDVSIVHVLMC